MIGTLVTHCGARRISRQELAAIAPPAGTRTWKPVAHAELVETLIAELDRRSLDVRAEAYAVQRQGALLFGVIDLGCRGTEESTAAIGIRTANDKTFSLSLAVGVRVFVCDNLVFSGDLIALRRRHTAGLDLAREVARALDRYQEGLLRLEEGIARLKERPISEGEAKAMIFDVFRQAIPSVDTQNRPVVDT